jgi:hypothetical protein
VLIRDGARWREIRPMSMPNFLKQFSLHDSWLKALTIDSQGKVILEVGFDLVWNPSVPPGHDTLWIRFDHSYRVRWMQGGWEQSTLTGAESAKVAAGDRAALLDDTDFDVRAYQGAGGPQTFTHPSFDESLTSTRFQLVNWAIAEVLHSEPVRCVVADASGDEIDLATFSDVPPS